MNTVTLAAAFIPLVDAAPLIVAEEMGFAAREGVSLNLVRAPSWSSLRDMLTFGRVDVAQLLSPMPVAMALGIGGVAAEISAVSVMSVNGTVIGVSRKLAGQMRGNGFGFGFDDPVAAGLALKSAPACPLRFGVPFPFSMHHELLRYWFEGIGLVEDDFRILTIPPPMMADALERGEIDAFCVGEPWGSIVVERDLGELLLPGSAIWAFYPEKVLAAPTEWARQEPEALGRIMRAVWRAGQWLARPESAVAAAEILSRKEYLDVPAEIIDRSLSGLLTVSPRGELRRVDRFVEFHDGAASFPWRSQAAWMADRISQRFGLDPRLTREAAQATYRSDLFRIHLGGSGAALPGASSKLEGAIVQPTGAASAEGAVILQPDGFFDGRIFDPGQE